jgi:hypothetical protein
MATTVSSADVSATASQLVFVRHAERNVSGAGRRRGGPAPYDSQLFALEIVRCGVSAPRDASAVARRQRGDAIDVAATTVRPLMRPSASWPRALMLATRWGRLLQRLWPGS